VAEKQASGDWHVNQWAKKAVLLGFRIKDMEQQDGGPQGGGWWDKVDSKFTTASSKAGATTNGRPPVSVRCPTVSFASPPTSPLALS